MSFLLELSGEGPRRAPATMKNPVHQSCQSVEVFTGKHSGSLETERCLILLNGDIHLIGNERLIHETQFVEIDKAWRKWGERCASHFTGEFSLAIWDKKLSFLYFARDHAGTQPLFWRRKGRSLFVASNIEFLVSIPGLSTNLNETEIRRFLTDFGQAEASSATMHKDILRLPPGCWMTFDGSSVSQKTYWAPSDEGELEGEKLVEQAQELLTEAVACRLQPAGRSYATHFSGGLDSSAVAVLAQRQLQKKGYRLSAHCWNSEAQGELSKLSEHRRIRAIAEENGLRCKYLNLTPQDWAQAYETDVSLIPPSSIALETFCLEQMEAQGVERVFSGWGGDQAISFYGWGGPSILLRTLQFKKLLALAGSESGQYSGPRYILNTLRFLWYQALLPFLPDSLYKRWAPFPLEFPSRLKLLRPCFAQKVAPANAKVVYRKKPRPFLNQAQHFKLGSVAVRTEAWGILGQKLGIRYSYPLLDRRLLEFVFRLPPSVYWTQRGKRAFFRSMIEPLLPLPVVWSRDEKYERDHAREMQKLMEAGYRLALKGFRAKESLYRANPWIDTSRLWEAAESLSMKSHPSDRAAIARALHILKVWEYHS